jgi:hypothetical protein
MAVTDENIRMTADVMEKGGVAVTSASWGISWMGFLDAHSQGILALCGIIGLGVTLIGAGLKWIQMTIEHRARMRNITRRR